MSSKKSSSFLRLSPDCSLKLLESPCLFDRRTDELYELDTKAFSFFKTAAAGTAHPGPKENDFIDFCLREQMLLPVPEKKRRRMNVRQSPLPSFRYLEAVITRRCNLKCAHCYLGKPQPVDLDPSLFEKVLREFQENGGLRVILSGGEPLMHPAFWHINDSFPEYDLRFVLLTNGTLIDASAAKRFKCQEIQISLDGWGASHELLRGKGTFDKILAGVSALRAAGTALSFATVIHPANLDDFGRMSDFIRKSGALSWKIDYLCPDGNMLLNPGLSVDYGTASRCFAYGFGDNYHSPSADYACGPHLACLTPKGMLVKCGYFADEPGEDVRNGLVSAWDTIPKLKLEELECDCDHLSECRGGCRYRALLDSGRMTGRDKAKCGYYGVNY